MQKVKSNAWWTELKPKERKALEDWLFEDQLSYDETLKRAKEKFNYRGSRSSLRRFYERTAQERNLDLFADAKILADAADGMDVSLEHMRQAGMKVIAQTFIRQVVADPDNVKQWGFLAKLLLHSEENQLRREMQRDDSEIRREQLNFHKVRYQYNAIEEALKALPELEKLAEAQEEASLTEPEWNKRHNDMRKRMWGEVIPDLLPETEEELAHPEIIKQRFEEMIKRPIVMRKDGTWEYSKVPIQKPAAPIQKTAEPPVQPPPSLKGQILPHPDDDPEAAFEEAPPLAKPMVGRASTSASAQTLRRDEPCVPQSTANKPPANPIPKVTKEMPSKDVQGVNEKPESQGRASTPCAPQSTANKSPQAMNESPSSQPSPPMGEKVPAGRLRGSPHDSETLRAPQPAPEPEPPPPFVDEPRKLTKEEREQEYRELMRRAREMRGR